MSKMILALSLVIFILVGCRSDENERLAEQAERSLERLAAQEARNTELHQQVAEGTKRLVDADASTREAIIELHRDIQSERSEIGRQRDELEAARMEIASVRSRAPRIAEAQRLMGLSVLCVLAILIALQIGRRRHAGRRRTASGQLLINRFETNAASRSSRHRGLPPRTIKRLSHQRSRRSR